MGSLHIERRDGIALFRFDNPPSGFLDGAMTGALAEGLDQVLADVAIRAIILTGAGDGVFIRHFDLPELSCAAEALAAAPPPARPADWSDSIFHRITRRIESCDVPVIAAINGDCMGVGFELALACDIRIARAGPFSLGLPEMNIAMLPGGGGTARLARLIAPSLAFELIATARVLEPVEALHWGVVNAVSPDPLASALALAERMKARSATGIAAAKRVIRQSRDLPIEQALTLEQREVDARLGGEEVRAVLRAYAASGEDLRRPMTPDRIAARR